MFKHFPFDNDSNGWKVDKSVQLTLFRLEDRFENDMWGGFSYRELALMSVDEMLELGWKPPENG